MGPKNVSSQDLQLALMPHLIYWDSPESPTGMADALGHIATSEKLGPYSFIVLAAHLSVPEACLQINRELNTEPVVLITVGSRCLDLPTIARAQAAAHRPVIGYSLVHPIFPTSTDQWPQAPVTVYLPHDDDPERLISLRGYHIVHFSGADDLAHLILDQSLTAQ